MEPETGLPPEMPVLVAEPVAAVIAYGLGRERDESLVLVVDLGGGTYDISLVECFEGEDVQSRWDMLIAGNLQGAGWAENMHTGVGERCLVSDRTGSKAIDQDTC